jgi:hypothetical protein
VAGVFAVLVGGATGAGSASRTGSQGKKRPDIVLTTRRPIRELAADGKGFAVMTSSAPDYERDVTHVVNAWAAPGRKRASFVIRHDDCYHGCGELAVAGNDVAWVEGAGGNSLQLFLMLAKLSGGRLKGVDEADNGAGAGEDPEGSWLGEVLGGGGLLAYNRWDEVCTQEPLPPGYACGEWATGDRELVRLASGHPVVVESGTDVCPLAAVGGGRMAVATVEGDKRDRNVGEAPEQGNDCDSGAPGSAGAVIVLDPSGARLATISAVKDHPPFGIALSRMHLAILRSRTLDLYDPATGAKTKTLPVGAAAGLGLGGVTSKFALLRDVNLLVLVRLSDGKRISLPLKRGAATGVIDAKLTDAGLFYAFDVRRGSAKGRIVFEPMAKLLARF